MDTKEYIIGGIITCVVLTILIALGKDVIHEIKYFDQEKQDNKDYQSFKKDTEVIKGTVNKAEKEKHFIFPDAYNVVVKTGDSSKMVSVSESEYRNYQAGNKAHFRIDKTNDNKIVRDLKKENDITSLKEYKKYKNHPRGLFDNILEKR